MQLYVIRHAEAEPGGAVGDAARRLTPRGQQEARALAAALRARAVRWDALLTSPRERARETAALLAPALASSAPEPNAVLDGRAPADAILDELAACEASQRIALVGHMPVVAELVALATGGAAPRFPTAAVALVEFPERAAPGRGRLAWLLAPGATETTAP